MLKKLGWGFVALTMLAGLACAAGGSDGGMSINSLSTSITTALTNLTNAVNSSFITPGTASNPSTDIVSVNTPPGIALSTNPQSTAPNKAGTGIISVAGAYVSIPVGPLGSLGVQLAITGSATVTAACSMDGDLTAPIALKLQIRGTGADTTPPAASVAASGNYVFEPGNCDHIRIVAGTLSASGQVAVTWLQTGAAYMGRVTAPPSAPAAIADAGSSNPAFGTTPLTGAGTALQGNIGAGNFYGAYATNLSAANVGFLAVLNAVAVPASGATIAPVECVPYGTNGGSIFYQGMPPKAMSAGIVVVLTTDASCAKYTPGSMSAFISLSQK